MTVRQKIVGIGSPRELEDALRAEGRRVPFRDMPMHMWDAVDDDFRSLAAFVRDAGGYEKTDVPLADFRWAELFRAHFPRPRDDVEFDALLKPAIDFARSETAAGLPGYKG